MWIARKASLPGKQMRKSTSVLLPRIFHHALDFKKTRRGWYFRAPNHAAFAQMNEGAHAW
jgi:hypothetical protein